MCGICGFNWADKVLIKKMAEVISHRGPDDEGFFVDNHMSLGHKRLSIIDLSKKGKQPIFNEDKDICVIFNGEIYNFKEIRRVLEEKGHRFYSNTDTEVIVHAYEEFGENCVKQFNGMFAFAIYDSGKKKLLLARDRLGVKQLYYTLNKGRFLFASEIKALLQYEEIKREVNKKALINYLNFRYIPFSQTIFENVMELPPGHILTYENNKLKLEKYWDLILGNTLRRSEEYYSKAVLQILKKSVEKRMMSDVPFGAYLSGGIDSSIIVAVMKGLVEKPVKPFTVGFEAPEPINEANYAKELAEFYGTEHHELVVKADSAYLLPKVIWHLDNLISDPTIIAQYLLSEFTKKYVTVVLTGEGADELFGGYDEFKFMYLASKYLRPIPSSLRYSLVYNAANLIPDKFLNKFFEFKSRLGERGMERFSSFLKTLNEEEKSLLNLVSFFTSKEKKEIYSDKLLEIEKKYADYEKQLKPYLKNSNNLLDNLIYIDVQRRLPYYLLHKIDKMSMAHAIETRVPFLDYTFVEFSFTIPPFLKLKRFNEKYILKKGFASYLPKKIFKRKKHPFVVPFDLWYEDSIKDIADQVFSNSTVLKEYFNHRPIRGIMEKYHKSPFYYGRQIWSLLSFDIWHRIYIENKIVNHKKLSIDKLY